MKWKRIKGFEKKYRVSSNGDVYSIYLKKNLKPCLTFDGYQFIRLSNKPIGISTQRLHRLVAMHFIPNPHNKPQVNHIDGDKLNNDVSNLEWVDQFENMAHAIKNGLFPRRDGKHNSRAKQVINLETGIVYDTAKDAAYAHEMPATTLRSYLNGWAYNKSSMRYL